MKLYYFDTLNPRKACALVQHLQAPVEMVHTDLGKGEHKTAAFRALNPNAKVPVLEDGARSIWESNAIMCHVAARMNSDMWPRDDRQIDVVRWLSWDSSHFLNHGGGLYFEHIIKPRFGLGEADAAAVAQAQTNWRISAKVLNDHLRGRDVLVGDGLTVADFAVAICLPYADAAKIPLAEFPEIRRWHDRLNALPAWRNPFPSPALAA